MRNRWMTMCCVLLLAAACGKEENNADNSATNNASNNATSNQTSANNTSNDPNNTSNGTSNSTNTSNDPNNNTNANPRTEPFVTRFSYYVEDTSIGANDGYTISIVSGDIANQSGNMRTMSVEDAATFEATYMTADLIGKMRNGWDCPAVGGDDMGMADMGGDMGDAGPGFVDEARHIFEARIQEGGIDTEIQNVTGCVQGDVQEVMELIEAVNTLGEQYL